MAEHIKNAVKTKAPKSHKALFFSPRRLGVIKLNFLASSFNFWFENLDKIFRLIKYLQRTLKLIW